MTPVDRSTFAERVAAVERHLSRVESRLPADRTGLEPMSDATDAVVLHLWQAVQLVIDVATSLCVGRGLGVPRTYADAFRALADDGLLERDLADRLARAAGFRNLVVHAYADLDLARVHEAASDGPEDLRAFLSRARDAFDHEPS